MRGIREKAGLGSPPLPYFTNSNEAMNRVIKEKVQWKKNHWPEFNTKMQELVSQQQREVEKAIINEGEYSLQRPFKDLEVSEPGRWWRMTEEQRLHQIKRFNSFTIEEGSIRDSEVNSRKGKQKKQQETSALPDQEMGLSLSAEDAAALLSIPLATAQGIWHKAGNIYNNPAAIVAVPGGDAKDRFVLSTTSAHPHLVKSKGDLYTCDHRCMHFQSLSLCSHTVAAASRQDDLSDFLQTLAGKMKAPNLYQFSKHGMPPGAGRKGGKLPRKKLPKRPLTSHIGVTPASSATVQPSDPSASKSPLSEIYQSNQHSASTPILSLAGSSVATSLANKDQQPHVTAMYSQPVVSMPTVQPAGLSSDQSAPPVHTVYSQQSAFSIPVPPNPLSDTSLNQQQASSIPVPSNPLSDTSLPPRMAGSYICMLHFQNPGDCCSILG